MDDGSLASIPQILPKQSLFRARVHYLPGKGHGRQGIQKGVDGLQQCLGKRYMSEYSPHG